MSNTVYGVTHRVEYMLAVRLILIATTIVTILTIKFKPINIFLAILSLLCFVMGVSSVITDLHIQLGRELKIYNYSLKRTPNIYLYILESYHNLSTMRQVYNIDTSNLEDFLDKNNFIIYEDALSNSDFTTLSLADIFSMQLDSVQSRGNHSAATTFEIMMGGGYGNNLLMNLKNNGYQTEYTHLGLGYTFGFKGQYLDKNNLNPICVLLRPFTDMNMRFKKFLSCELPIDQAVIQSIDEKSEIKIPLFRFFKGGAIHTSLIEYTWRDADWWVASRQYQNAVERSNKELMKIVEHILKRDPGSIIVMLGDHGSGRLRHLWGNERTFEKLEQKVYANGETLDSLVQDMFGIFMAVRMPDGREDISNGYHMSPVNLFRNIFYSLSDNDIDILNDSVPSDSKYHRTGCTIARGGKILFDGLICP